MQEENPANSNISKPTQEEGSPEEEKLAKKPKKKFLVIKILAGLVLTYLFIDVVVMGLIVPSFLVGTDTVLEVDKNKVEQTDIGDKESTSSKYSLLCDGNLVSELSEDYIGFGVVDDWLIYVSPEWGNYSLYAYNPIEQQKVEIISDSDLRKTISEGLSRIGEEDFSDEDINSFYGKSIKKHGDDVIYSVQGYMTEAFLFKVDSFVIDEAKKPQQYLDTTSFSVWINLYDEKSIFYQAWGDACGRSSYISTFDYKNFVPLGERIEFGTDKDREFLGYFPKDDSLIYTDFSTDTSGGACGFRIFKNLKSTDFSGSEKTYIELQNLPEDTRDIGMVDGSSKVFLLTEKKLYVFDLEKEELSLVGEHNVKDSVHIGSSSNSGRLYIGSIHEGVGICINEGVLLDDSTGKILEVDGSTCTKLEDNVDLHYREFKLPISCVIKEN